MHGSMNNKRVLFYYPPFFGYDQEIMRGIREKGGIVDMFDPRLAKTVFQRALYKILPKVFEVLSVGYHRNILQSVAQNDYDDILVMESIPRKILRKMRTMFPKTKMICYFADSAANMPNLCDRLDLFDEVFTYDRVDAQRLGIRFRPLFYIDKYCAEKYQDNEDFTYDVSFVGTCHSDRYSVIHAFDKSCKGQGISLHYYLYLQSRFMYYFYLLTNAGFRGARVGEFSFHKLDAIEASRIVRQSKAVFDVQHPNNHGLTMRTIEMIGMKKKIITTNADIVHYDFYHPANIRVVSRDNPTIEKAFFDLDYVPLDEEMYRKYSLDGWLDDVFGVVSNEK